MKVWCIYLQITVCVSPSHFPVEIFYGFNCLKPSQFANASVFCLKTSLEDSSLCVTFLREKSHKRASRCTDSDRKEMHQDAS